MELMLPTGVGGAYSACKSQENMSVREATLYCEPLPNLVKILWLPWEFLIYLCLLCFAVGQVSDRQHKHMLILNWITVVLHVNDLKLFVCGVEAGLDNIADQVGLLNS